MFAPRPTNRFWLLVLLACLAGSSLASFASTTLTVYRPLAAVQVPRLTGRVTAPGAIVPLAEPVSVRTTAPVVALVTVSVMPCAPLAEAIVPWLRIATVNVTVAPFCGMVGVQLTGEATRSDVGTAVTTSAVGLVKALLVSFFSIDRVVLVDLGVGRVAAGVAGTDVRGDRRGRAGRERADGRGAGRGGAEVEVDVGGRGLAVAGVADGRRQRDRVALRRRLRRPGERGDREVRVRRRGADDLELGDLTGRGAGVRGELQPHVGGRRGHRDRHLVARRRVEVVRRRGGDRW